MVNKVNLTGMTAWNFNKGNSEWKQEKLNRNDFAEILAKEEGRLRNEMLQMREGNPVGRQDVCSEPNR